MKHAIRPAARDDIIRQFRYYLVDQDRPDVANRFVEAVEKAIDKIVRTPNAGALPSIFRTRRSPECALGRWRNLKISAFTI